MTPGFEAGLVIPDLWQQEAVRALQQGKDVVVQAPTGSGKTYIFELLYPNLKTQAVFTVPTRALVLDKHSNRYGSRHGCLYRKAVASVRDVVSIRNNESNWCPFSFGQMIRRCRFESLKQT